MDFNGKKIVVVGAGKTGIATAKFLGGRGAKVLLTDEKPINLWSGDFELIAGEKWLEAGKYDKGIFEGVTMVIPSPGVPPGNVLLIEAQKKKIPIISEIELACRFLKTPLIAVTGTNGKTTTTTLLGEILKKAGKKIFVGGNIGNPLIERAVEPVTDEFLVAEVSSFQLQWVETFHPFVSILLNVASDHTDYHGSFAEYVRIKSRIFANQTKDDFAIVNADDQAQQKIVENIRAKVVLFSSRRELDEGIFLKADKIILRMSGFNEEIYQRNMIKLPGLHNVENVMAAIVAARLCGCASESIKECVSDFHGLPHRIEFAGEKNSIKFYDDSKGTNTGSVLRALETFSQPVILLLGGRDKNGDFEKLKSVLPVKAKQIILFGEAQERISLLIGNNINKLKTPKLQDAVEAAYKNAKPGDVVLLSPGCASFDEFKDYKERGEFFKQLVRSL